MIEVFGNSDKVGAMLYFFMVAHKAACQPCLGLLEVYEDMVEVLLVLEIILTEDS